jgi:hypothetical protein
VFRLLAQLRGPVWLMASGAHWPTDTLRPLLRRSAIQFRLLLVMPLRESRRIL